MDSIDLATTLTPPKKAYTSPPSPATADAPEPHRNCPVCVYAPLDLAGRHLVAGTGHWAHKYVYHMLLS